MELFNQETQSWHGPTVFTGRKTVRTTQKALNYGRTLCALTYEIIENNNNETTASKGNLTNEVFHISATLPDE